MSHPDLTDFRLLTRWSFGSWAELAGSWTFRVAGPNAAVWNTMLHSQVFVEVSKVVAIGALCIVP